jgi:signal transduction histidine kinase
LRAAEARISFLIFGGMMLLIGVVVWLSYGRYALLDAIEDDFGGLQQVARTGRVAADVAGRLSALSAVIREYVASDAIEPPARISAEAQSLMGAIAEARADLPREKTEIDRIESEAAMYLASFDAVVAARRQRQARLKQLAVAAGTLRAAADEAGQRARFTDLREAEVNYLASRGGAEAERVAERSATLRQALGARALADLGLDYDLAFARVVEIHGVVDQATIRVLDEHDARLRGLTGALGRRAQSGEGVAVTGFRERLSAAIRRNLEVTTLLVIGTIAGAFLLVRFVVWPLNRMTGAMTGIAGGDYARDIPYTTRADEIGQMARSLSTFRKALLELKAAQAQAETASRHKTEFIANMSHELRTPLNAIIGLSDMLIEDAEHPDPQELKQSLPRISSSARQLLALINEILDLSRIEAGRMALEISAFSPAALAEESLATVAPLARQKGLALSSACLGEVPVVESDPQRVRQILINLAGNAVKFCERGQVRLEVSADAEAVRFAVIDTGLGIAPADLPRLFQEFTQLDASSTRKYGGSGLGLALSRRMAHLIGGDVSVKSELGAGSTFTLTIPRRRPA